MTVTKRGFPRCAAIAKKDGLQCGRRVKDASQPPLCHLHKPGATNALTQRVDRSPLEIIQKLMGDSDPSIRLRAVEMYQKYEDRLATKSRPDDTDELIARATREQLVQLHDLVVQLHAWKAVVRRQPLQEEEELDNGPEREYPEPTGAAAPTPKPATVQPAAANDSQPEREEVTALPRERWDEVGLYEMNGVITHNDGDEVAQQILDGTINFDDAKAEHQASIAKLHRVSNMRSTV